MADLTLQLLSDALPAGAIIDDTANTDVKISLKALIGEASVSMSSEKLAESIAKLLNGANAAQTEFNTTAPTPITSYPVPSFAAPTLQTDGNYYARRTYTVSVMAPLNLDEVVAI